MTDCLFCQIAAGEVPAHIVYEDETCIAFLDHRPVFPGHTLLIPREHFETLADLPCRLIRPFFSDAQLLSISVQNAMEAEGTFVGMNNRISQSVPHLHIHVVPRRRKDGLRGFFWPRQKYASDEAMETVRARIEYATLKLKT